MPNLGPLEIIVILSLALIIFGAWYFLKSLIEVYVKAQKSNKTP